MISKMISTHALQCSNTGEVVVLNMDKIAISNYMCGGLRHCTLHRCRSLYSRCRLVTWAGYVMYVMLWLCVHAATEMG